MVGRISPIKGQHLFLSAFARAFPDGSQRAIVVGSPLFNEQAYEEEIHFLAHRLGISERVEFRPFTEDVEEAYGQLDVFVLASLVPEGFSLVVAEAMALGLPVIAPSAGGPAENIQDRVTGLLYSLGDEQGLAECMVALCGDSDMRARIGKAAAEKAADFSVELVAIRCQAAYVKAISCKRRSRFGSLKTLWKRG